jgi:GntR family transcriptional regulator
VEARGLTPDSQSSTKLPRRLSGRSPKGEQLREILEGLIAGLEPGAPLPSERALAERYGVARMTVRTELDRLVSEGLAYRVQGRGTFVGEARVAQSMEFSSFTEDMRARGMTPGSRVLDQDVVPASELVAARLGLVPGAAVVRVHRVRTADDEPMAVEQAFLPSARFTGLESEDLAGGSLFELLEARWGVELPFAEQRVVALRIADEQAQLLGVDPGQPGFMFRTVAHEPAGQPVFYAWSLYRGDRYEIQLRQRRAASEATQ